MTTHIIFDPNIHLQLSKNNPLSEKVDETGGDLVSWGGLRLFTSTLQFFNYYVDTTADKILCVYAGAAPGVSIRMAYEFYPQIEYHLYDPNGNSDKRQLAFDDELFGLRNVYLYNENFTMDTAGKWKKYIQDNPTHRLYFISDIRTSDYPEKPTQNIGESNEVFQKRLEKILKLREDIVTQELRQQETWVKEMIPAASLLKFRPPRSSVTGEKVFTYMDGYLYLGVFGDSTSSECFIVPNDYVTPREWNTEEYEKAMNYHNAVFRKQNFRNPLTGGIKNISKVLGLLNDYDSTLFVLTVLNMMERYSIETSILNSALFGEMQSEEILRQDVKIGDPMTKRDIALLLCARIIKGLGRVYTEGPPGRKGVARKAPTLASRRAKLAVRR